MVAIFVQFWWSKIHSKDKNWNWKDWNYCFQFSKQAFTYVKIISKNNLLKDEIAKKKNTSQKSEKLM